MQTDAWMVQGALIKQEGLQGVNGAHWVRPFLFVFLNFFIA